ncbi:MAG: hypothetical protein GY762_06410 [Proteobacteria bacterium]|nr:hypothetical protein [Pseudomonadota bacterium]
MSFFIIPTFHPAMLPASLRGRFGRHQKPTPKYHFTSYPILKKSYQIIGLNAGAGGIRETRNNLN